MIAAMIQARMTSSRLPNKVLKDINGRPMFSYMMERVAAARNLDKVVVVTSIDPSDNPISEFCKKDNILCFRGSLEDVLDRYYQAAVVFNADIIVRLTGDCPLIDPGMIDSLVDFYNNGKSDYAANTKPPPGAAPDGMDVEVFSFSALKRAWNRAEKPSDREHVTSYLWKNPQHFSTLRYNLPKDLSGYRITVDYPEDFEVIKLIISRLYSENSLFTMKDIINLLRNNPDIYNLNSNIKTNRD